MFYYGLLCRVVRIPRVFYALRVRVVRIPRVFYAPRVKVVRIPNVLLGFTIGDSRGSHADCIILIVLSVMACDAYVLHCGWLWPDGIQLRFSCTPARPRGDRVNFLDF